MGSWYSWVIWSAHAFAFGTAEYCSAAGWVAQCLQSRVHWTVLYCDSYLFNWPICLSAHFDSASHLLHSDWTWSYCCLTDSAATHFDFWQWCTTSWISMSLRWLAVAFSRDSSCCRYCLTRSPPSDLLKTETVDDFKPSSSSASDWGERPSHWSWPSWWITAAVLPSVDWIPYSGYSSCWSCSLSTDCWWYCFDCITFLLITKLYNI